MAEYYQTGCQFMIQESQEHRAGTTPLVQPLAQLGDDNHHEYTLKPRTQWMLLYPKRADQLLSSRIIHNQWPS